jgi:hypothetical protein
MATKTMSLDDVPIELRKLAVAAMNANDALPEDDRDQTPDHILAAVLPEHERMVREKAAKELEAQGKKIADEAAYKVAAGDDGAFSVVLRGASVSWAAKFVRGEVTA